MGVEIERKFLVVGEGWRGGGLAVEIRQGYLNLDPDRTVRVRIAGEAAFLTVKGRARGAVRAEFEYPVPVADAEALLGMCEGGVIAKTRTRLPAGDVVWEVDEFTGDNAGLVVAECELATEDQPFERPAWLGEEVTDDPRYGNSSLARAPFRTWGI
jgi:CYTH domain-containing protein